MCRRLVILAIAGVAMSASQNARGEFVPESGYHGRAELTTGYLNDSFGLALDLLIRRLHGVPNILPLSG